MIYFDLLEIFAFQNLGSEKSKVTWCRKELDFVKFK